MDPYFQIQITESLSDKIVKIVKKIGQENLNESNLLQIVIFIVSIIIIFLYLVKIEVNSNGTNWEKNKCSSKYVFFSGFMKNNGNELNKSLTNFSECITRFL